MPVTARLSKKFYDALGEDVARELVDWFNQVDATYRADLKTLNDLNFARFDAKLEQRIAELGGRLDARITRLEDRMNHQFAEQNERLEKALANQRAELIKWMFLFFVASALSVIGLAGRF